MKKLILFLLTAALLILPLSGCFADNKQSEETTPNNTTENTTPEVTTPEVTTPDNPPEVTTPDNPPANTPTYERSQELDDVFTMIEKDAAENSKIMLSIAYEELHFELKNSGLYEACAWDEAVFFVNIDCNYDLAKEEQWYLLVSQPNLENLNEAFYNQYASTFPNGEFSNIFFCTGFHLNYSSLEDFNADYSAIKALLSLEYVTAIQVMYSFGLPHGYHME